MIRKTFITLALLYIVGGMTTSCKKVWTCQCEPEDNSGLSVQHYPIENETKKDAKTKCAAFNTEELDCNLR